MNPEMNPAAATAVRVSRLLVLGSFYGLLLTFVAKTILALAGGENATAMIVIGLPAPPYGARSFHAAHLFSAILGGGNNVISVYSKNPGASRSRFSCTFRRMSATKPSCRKTVR